jgi:DNA-binding response OmpR family regulator
MAQDVGDVKKTVLILDEDESDRILFSRVLRQAGYETLEARCESEAVTVLANHKCDLILLGLGKGLSGADTLSALKRAKVIPVLAVAPDTKAKKEALCVGYTLCIERPLDLRRLPWRVGSVLRKKRRVLGVSEESTSKNARGTGAGLARNASPK